MAFLKMFYEIMFDSMTAAYFTRIGEWERAKQLMNK